MLTTHPLLVPRLRKSRSYTSSHPNSPLWSVTGPIYLFFPDKGDTKYAADDDDKDWQRGTDVVPVNTA
jgi:hypothetical protein